MPKLRIISITLFIVIAFSSSILAQKHIPKETKLQIEKWQKTHPNSSKTYDFVGELNCDSEAINSFDNNIIIRSRIGNILSLNVPHSSLDKLFELNEFKYLKHASKINPRLEKAALDLRTDSVYQGINLPQGYTGKDVFIGITDWGFDYSHPMFYDTSLNHTRIHAAWDQFKTSGPHPSGFNYGTEFDSPEELLAVQKDTFGVYEYATHGSHVAGIAGGGGAGTLDRGIAYESEFLMVSFLVNEAAVLDAFQWMKEKADAAQKRLVINMSWGLHHIGTLDGNSPISKAIDEYSKLGVVFVTSGGNNGDTRFHIKKSFDKDTLKSRIEFYPFNAHPKMWGQSITMWGEEQESFEVSLKAYSSDRELLYEGKWYHTSRDEGHSDSTIILGSDTFKYNLLIEKNHPINQRPYIRLRVQNKGPLRIGLFATSNSGTVHFWNVTELTNDVGNWGMPFSALFTDWQIGDRNYGIGEPACSKSAISVGAHNSERRLQNGNRIGGTRARFSSYGPTLDGRTKPDVYGPGENVNSSVSSYTTRNYTKSNSVLFNGREYPFSEFSGTSMSSPAVAGVVALMLEANPNLSAPQVKEILIKTAREDIYTQQIPDSGSNTWGWGKVNAPTAIQLALKTEGEFQLPSQHNVIYPNPTSSKFYFQSFSSENEFVVRVYQNDGKFCFERIIQKNEAIDIKGLRLGLYHVQIIDGNISSWHKLIIANHE